MKARSERTSCVYTDGRFSRLALSARVPKVLVIHDAGEGGISMAGGGLVYSQRGLFFRLHKGSRRYGWASTTEMWGFLDM